MLHANAKKLLDISKTLRGSIPDYSDLDLKTQNHYKNLLSQIGHLEDSVIGDLQINKRASSQFRGLISNMESLFDEMDDFIKASYQQKFDLQKFGPKLMKIYQNFEELKTLKRELRKELVNKTEDLIAYEEVNKTIRFLKTENEECQKSIENWKPDVKRLCEIYNEGGIELAKQQVEQLKVEYDQATGEKKLLTGYCMEILQLAMDDGKRKDLQILQENLDFNKANSEFQTALKTQKKILCKLKNDLASVVQAGYFLRDEFDQIDIQVNDLCDEAALDIIFNSYKDQVKLEVQQDIPNMMKIACKVLEIEPEYTANIKALELLFSRLHPRDFATFSQDDEYQKDLIRLKLETICSDEKQSKEDECEALEEEMDKLQGKLNSTRKDERKLKDSLLDIEEQIEMKERQINELKQTKIKENQIDELKKTKRERLSNSDEDKEDRNDTDYSSSDEDDFTNLSITKARNDLRFLLEKAAKAKDDRSDLKNKRKHLDRKIDGFDTEIRKIKAEIETNKRITSQTIEKVIVYYEILRSELSPIVQKHVHVIRNQKLETMQNSLKRSIYEPLHDYLKDVNNYRILDQKEYIKSIIALGW